ncbi:MAG: zinc ribbon domain-containing protein [Ruminococcaceae bacterium]|nr:zinc ribbon domain-containing protein [Oscillospiraceae bacterium]
MFCPFCGAELLDRSKYCESCGKALNKNQGIFISDSLFRIY